MLLLAKTSSVKRAVDSCNSAGSIVGMGGRRFVRYQWYVCVCRSDVWLNARHMCPIKRLSMIFVALIPLPEAGGGRFVRSGGVHVAEMYVCCSLRSHCRKPAETRDPSIKDAELHT